MHVFKSKLVIGLLALVVAGGGGFAYTQLQDDSKKSDRPINSVDYSGPTNEEAKAGDEQKDRNRERQVIDKENKPAQTAEIIIVDAGQYEGVVEVRAYVSNIYEDGGTCVVNFTRGSDKVTASGTAFKDVRTTQCVTISIPRADFNAAGEWQYTVSYSSATASGQTSSKSLTIK